MHRKKRQAATGPSAIRVQLAAFEQLTIRNEQLTMKRKA
jgi:hypothetical protein